ncbi:ABC transporter substrate-binding protein [Vallitalea pronyensis]|uniref:ABC transporter substrate-binding protein n=1 Tax=Vallitalea pronyensis TaxID=1348613 RepID=A0A8J8SHE1_9FIRM|nr:ABC transporter substrate-binding protein [Vallitalea pronyensis]QUI23770.1 ABC transporter substrate-binding protein [Vallitalea pronyensis]
MKKLKQAVCLLLMICLLFLLTLTGCDRKGDTASHSQDNQSNEDMEPMTLKMIAGSNGKQKDHDKVIAKANEILQELIPNTTIDIEFIPFAEYGQKFDLMMAGQETIDIAWNSYNQSLRSIVNKGALLPLNDLVDNHAPDIKKEIPDWLLAGGLVENELYMIPKYEMHFWQLAIYSPQAKFEKYFDMEQAKKVFNVNQEYMHITSDMWDFLEDYMKKADDAGDLGKGFSPWVFTLNEGQDLIGDKPPWTYGMPASTRIYTPGNPWDFTVLNTYKRPEIIEMFKKYADWREKGYIIEDMISLQNPRLEIENANTEDGALIFFHGYQNPKLEGEYYIENRWELPTVRFPIQQYPMVTTNNRDGLTIPVTAKDPIRSMKVIELLETKKGKEFYNTLIYGIEGEHYKKINDNRVEYTVGTNERRSLESTYGQANFVLGNCHNAYVNQLDLVDDYTSYWEHMHQLSFNNPFGAFKYDDTDTINEITQIKSVLSEYVKGFICGYYTEESYNEFLSKLEIAGVDKVIGDVQKQVDAYLEEQGIPKTGYVIHE